MDKSRISSISGASLIDAKLEEHQLRGFKQCPGCGHKLQPRPVCSTTFSIIFSVSFLSIFTEHFVGVNNRMMMVHVFQDRMGLPAGVKFDPTDQELIEHLEAKVQSEQSKAHPLIDEFIPTIEGEDGICYTHPEKLPGPTLSISLINIDAGVFKQSHHFTIKFHTKEEIIILIENKFS